MCSGVELMSNQGHPRADLEACFCTALGYFGFAYLGVFVVGDGAVSRLGWARFSGAYSRLMMALTPREHSIEMQLKVRLLGADEVSEVWRIERPAEDADAHRDQ